MSVDSWLIGQAQRFVVRDEYFVGIRLSFRSLTSSILLSSSTLLSGQVRCWAWLTAEVLLCYTAAVPWPPLSPPLPNAQPGVAYDQLETEALGVN